MQLQKTLQRVLQVVQTVFVVKILPRQQHLGHGMVVLAEQSVIGIHQLALAHRGGSCLVTRSPGFSICSLPAPRPVAADDTTMS